MQYLEFLNVEQSLGPRCNALITLLATHRSCVETHYQRVMFDISLL